MRKIRGIMYSVLVLLVLSVSCVFVGCGGKVRLVDFSDQTDTAYLGQTYTFAQTTVKDTNGNTHRIEFDVQTESGAKVDVIANSFEVTVLENYTAVCRAELYEGEYVERTIRINVLSLDGVPSGEFPTAAVAGTEITVPDVKLVNTVTNETVVEKMPYTVMLNRSVVEVTDGKFTAIEAGIYTIAYSVEYDGKTFRKQYSFEVARTAPAANEVESFDCAASETNFVSTNPGAPQAWLSEYKGEQGVIEWTLPALLGYFNFMFTPRQSMTAYAGYKYIVFRMYVESGTYDNFRLTNENNGEGYQTVNPAADTMVKGQWYDYVFAIKPFTDNWKDDGNTEHAFCYVHLPNANGGKIYISDISVWKDLSDVTGFTFSASVNAKEGEEVTLTASNVPDGARVVYTVTDPDSKKQTLTGNTFVPTMGGAYSVTASLAGYYGESAPVTVNVTATTVTKLNGEIGTTATENTAVTVPTLQLVKVDDETNVLATLTANVTYDGAPVTLIGNTFTPDKLGDYTITYKGICNGHEYTRTYTVTVVRKAAAANEIESFDTPNILTLPQDKALDAVFGSTYPQAHYEPSRTDSNGVTENGLVGWTLNPNGAGWPHFYVAPRQTKTQIGSQGTHIVVRAMVSSGSKIGHFMLKAGSVNIHCLNVPSESTATIDGNVWTDFIFPLASYTEDWGTGKFEMSVEVVNPANAVVYISDISVLPHVTTISDLTATTSGTLKEGEEITVSVSGTGVESSKLHYTVFDASGAQVTLDGTGKFTATSGGTFTVIIRADGYCGEKSVTFNVQAAIEGRLGATGTDTMPQTGVEGTAITLPDAYLFNTVSNSRIDETKMTLAVTDRTGGTVTLTGNSFTPDKLGAYTVKYTRTYNGQPYSKEYTITVGRKAAAANEIESFDSPDLVDGTQWPYKPDAGTIEPGNFPHPHYEPSRTDGNGVTENGLVGWSIAYGGTNTDIWPNLVILPRQSKAQLTRQGTHIRIVAMASAGTQIIDFMLKTMSGSAIRPTNVTFMSVDATYGKVIEGNVWTEFLFDLSKMSDWSVDSTDTGDLNNNKLVLQFNIKGNLTNTVLYVADMSVVKRSAPAATEVESFDSAMSLDGVSVNSGSALWLNEYEGKEGVLQWNLGTVWAGVSFKPRQEKAAYTSYTYLIIEAYIPTETVINTEMAPGYVGIGVTGQSDILANNKDSIQTGTWVKLVFDMEKFTTYWDWDGDCEKARIFTYATNSTGTIYISDVSAANEMPV